MKLTDPAEELFKLYNRFRAFDANANKATYQALLEIFELGKHPNELLTILGIVCQRFSRLRALLKVLPHLDKDRRNRAENALLQLEELISPARLSMPWKQNLGSLPGDSFGMLDFLSPSVRAVYRYRVPSDSEQKQLLAQLDDTIASLVDQHDLMADAIVGALRAIRVVLNKLDVFGVEELTEKLATASFYFECAKKAEPEAQSQPKHWRFSNVAAILFRVAEIVVVTDQFPQAVEHHANRVQFITQSIIETNRPGLRQLPAPEGNSVSVNSRPDII